MELHPITENIKTQFEAVGKNFNQYDFSSSMSNTPILLVKTAILTRK
jgi:hypothetical protein